MYVSRRVKVCRCRQCWQTTKRTIGWLLHFVFFFDPFMPPLLSLSLSSATCFVFAASAASLCYLCHELCTISSTLALIINLILNRIFQIMLIFKSNIKGSVLCLVVQPPSLTLMPSGCFVLAAACGWTLREKSNSWI